MFIKNNWDFHENPRNVSFFFLNTYYVKKYTDSLTAMLSMSWESIVLFNK